MSELQPPPPPPTGLPPTAVPGEPSVPAATEPSGGRTTAPPGPSAASPASPPPKSTGGRLLVGCAVFGVVSAVLCCGCGGALSLLLPGMARSWLLEDHPLPGPTTEPDAAASAATALQACTAFAAGQEVHLTPDEVARWVVGDGSADLTVLRIGATGPQASLDLSVATDDSPTLWFNLQMVGSLELDHGWFTSLRTDSIVISGHDLSAYVAGQDLAVQANQSLANQRAGNPDVGPALDSVEHVAIADGAFVIKLTPDGLAKQALCDALPLDSLIPQDAGLPTGLE